MNSNGINLESARHLRFDLVNARIQLWYALKDRQFFGTECQQSYDLGPIEVDFWLPEAGVAVRLADHPVQQQSAEQSSEWLDAWLARRRIQLLFIDTLEILETCGETLQHICRLIEARLNFSNSGNRTLPAKRRLESLQVESSPQGFT